MLNESSFLRILIDESSVHEVKIGINSPSKKVQTSHILLYITYYILYSYIILYSGDRRDI